MSLNIKDQEAHRLAQSLAKETGETMTEAVRTALRERLERIGRRPKKKAAELMEIGKRCARHLRNEPHSHGELYDERGLPR